MSFRWAVWATTGLAGLTILALATASHTFEQLDDRFQPLDDDLDD